MAEHEEQRAPSSSLVWPSRDSCRQSQQRPTLCAVAGPNGSGKTTTTELLLANEWGANSLYINPDNIAEQEFGGWNNVEAVLKAAQRATEMRYQCLDKITESKWREVNTLFLLMQTIIWSLMLFKWYN